MTAYLPDGTALVVPARDLVVLTREVVDAGDGWLASEAGVGSVMVVEVEPAVKCLGSLAV